MSVVLEQVRGTVIRPFTEEDYPALTAIHNTVWPDNLREEADIRRWDGLRKPEHVHMRWVAERDGKTVGIGEFNHSEWMFHPRKFGLGIDVLPDYQGQGIGRALYDTIESAMTEHDPVLVRSYTRADKDRSIRFLADRGFEEEERVWESRLDVTSFDFSPYAGAEPHVLAQGITIHTYGELEADPDHLRRLYEMDVEVSQDIPTPEPLTQPEFERWKEMFTTDPNLLPDAYFIAKDGEEYVGISVLWRNKADKDLQTGLTGVRRAWRRKGIALALKLRAVAYARDHGAPGIRTDNSSLNRGMLSINERLGFQKLPAWIGFRNMLNAE